ncbi:MAG: phenylalanine--tRNA ligase subunit beta [Anaerolineales bacterium]|nr:phenylalanine--tRNA ligase subunit beta [Anaerolineales bacterium]
MKVPISWLKDFVDIDLPIEVLAQRLTLAGLEVEEIRFAGLPLPAAESRPGTKISGLAWDPATIVVGAILEVMPHPNADRLVLCRLLDGEREHTVLTGAPNLFPFKGQGPLPEPIRVAYAREGARLYDGHKSGWELMTLKRSKIRGVDSYSMACSEKELGISEDHEGIIFLDADAPTGMPLVEYMGDAVLDIAITPNMARNASILGVAREVAALTGKPLKQPSYEVAWTGAPIAGRCSLDIREPDLNPRFVLGLIEGVEPRPSPFWVQRRLRLAGMRPINAIVDGTNYVMLELGQPLHAFDYDVLLARSGGGPPEIHIRRAQAGELLRTLDGEARRLEDFTVLVADIAGPLSIAGVMGGSESEVSPETRRVLLEGACWEFINIRRTLASQKVSSEAGYRFSRGVHPAMAERGVLRGLEWMRRWTGGIVAQGLVDSYPRPVQAEPVRVTPADVERWLGIRLSASEIADLLERLEFEVRLETGAVAVHPPDHRLDIGSGVVGLADLMEEIGRMVGYDRIPETLIRDRLPAQRGAPDIEGEERLRQTMARLGLQEAVTYRLTSPEREARLRLAPTGEEPAYVHLANPIAADRTVLRRQILPGLMEAIERNARLRERITLFEIGPVFLPSNGQPLPEEVMRLAVVMTGRRALPGWQPGDPGTLDFFDLKGVIEQLMSELHVQAPTFQPAQVEPYLPGKCAALAVGEAVVGWMGELHPIFMQRYALAGSPVLAAEFDLPGVLDAMQLRQDLVPVSAFPPVLEDLAVVVDDSLPAARVEGVIRTAAGSLLEGIQLFDVYQGEQIGAGQKSLAYSLVYRSGQRTLTDEEVRGVRQRIVQALREELGASLRQ